MGCERSLRPIVQDALCGYGHELLGAFADQAHHLCTRFIVQSASGQDLRHLFTELAVIFQRRFDVLADRVAQSFL
jgi:hypothetical protein